MADIFDPEPLTLLCDESKDLCFDDLVNDGGAIDHDDDDAHHLGGGGGQGQGQTEIPQKGSNHCFSGVNDYRSEPSIHLPAQSEEAFASMVEKESEYLPKDDYLSRLRCGELDFNARKEACDWIWKAHSYYNFGPLTFCLAVNYLDRFLSIQELPKPVVQRENAWVVQLLAVACLSVAAKVEESSVPQSIDFQVGDPKFVFEAKIIQRMELLLLDTLNWKMNAVTPSSFLEHTLQKLSDAPPHHHQHSHSHSSSTTTNTKVVKRSMQLILSTIKGIDFLEFKPSEIAAAVAISASAEIQAVDIDKAISHFTHLEKDRVLKCVETIKDMPPISRSGDVGSTGQGVAESPIGVLDAACFSSTCDELTTTTMTTTIAVGGSSASSCSHIATSTTTTSSGSGSGSGIGSPQPDAKRQKLEISSSSTKSGLDS